MCRGFYPLLVVEIFKLSNAFRARVRNRVTGPADRTLPMILDFADENHISPSWGVLARVNTLRRRAILPTHRRPAAGGADKTCSMYVYIV